MQIFEFQLLALSIDTYSSMKMQVIDFESLNLS